MYKPTAAICSTGDLNESILYNTFSALTMLCVAYHQPKRPQRASFYS